MGSEDVAVGEIAGAKEGCSKMNRSLERFIRRKIPQRRVRCRIISKYQTADAVSVAIKGRGTGPNETYY
jgi:hypothetical protein